MCVQNSDSELFDEWFSCCVKPCSNICCWLVLSIQCPSPHCLQCVALHACCALCHAGVDLEETDHPELLMPPPAYDDAVNVNLYPPTPQMQRTVSWLCMSSFSMYQDDCVLVAPTPLDNSSLTSAFSCGSPFSEASPHHSHHCGVFLHFQRRHLKYFHLIMVIVTVFLFHFQGQIPSPHCHSVFLHFQRKIPSPHHGHHHSVFLHFQGPSPHHGHQSVFLCFQRLILSLHHGHYHRVFLHFQRQIPLPHHDHHHIIWCFLLLLFCCCFQGKCLHLIMVIKVFFLCFQRLIPTSSWWLTLCFSALPRANTFTSSWSSSQCFCCCCLVLSETGFFTSSWSSSQCFCCCCCYCLVLSETGIFTSSWSSSQCCCCCCCCLMLSETGTFTSSWSSSQCFCCCYCCCCLVLSETGTITVSWSSTEWFSLLSEANMFSWGAHHSTS